MHADRFARYRPVAHATCLDCHKDPHQDRFGQDCARCHSTDDWKRIVAGATAAREFHQKTRYPLEGAHRAVACAPCHGPFPGVPARFKPLAFQACTDCHVDAHAGQLSLQGAEAGRCDRCHELRGFLPARFGLEEHEKTAYRLEGAHRAVACVSCHPHDQRLAERLPAQTRAELARRGRPARVSLALYAVAGDLARCETCHADPHAGQLARPQGCAACHGLDSFHKVRFNHQKESRFALAGKHATAACVSCHRPEPGAAARLSAIARSTSPAPPATGTRTSGSSRSPAANGGPVAGCERCHGAEDWKTLRFRHEKPFTDYALTGKHQKVACAKCHPALEVAPGLASRRYKPLPRACEGCHADFHQGAFRGFEPRMGR